MFLYLIAALLANPVVLEVPGLTCPTCVAPVKKALALVDGVKAVRIDWRSRRVEVDIEVGKVDEGTLRARLAAAGFAAADEDTPTAVDTSLDYLAVTSPPPEPKMLAVWGKATVVAVCTPKCAPCDVAKRDLKLFAQRANRVAVRVVTVDGPESAAAAYLPKRAEIPYLYVFDTKAQQRYAGGMGAGGAVYRAVEDALGVKH